MNTDKMGSVICRRIWVYLPHNMGSVSRIGVGRFRVLGGPRFRILGGPRVCQIPSRHMTSFRRHVLNIFLINQCQIITFFIKI